MEDDNGVTSCTCQRVRERTLGVQDATSEEVLLARQDLCAILNLDRVGRSHDTQMQRHEAIALATGHLKRIGLRRIRGQQLTSEQIGLSGRHRGIIGCHLLRSEEQVQMNRAIAERVGVIRARGGQLLATEQVSSRTAHGSVVLRVDGRKRDCTQKRQQG